MHFIFKEGGKSAELFPAKEEKKILETFLYLFKFSC